MKMHGSTASFENQDFANNKTKQIYLLYKLLAILGAPCFSSSYFSTYFTISLLFQK